MISEQAFAFPFKDKIWLNKFLIGTALVLAGFFIPIIPTLFVWGYLVRLMRDIIDTGEARMPEWDRWEDLGLKGIYYLLISFIYVLPGLVLVVGTIALFALSRLVGGEPLVPDSIRERRLCDFGGQPDTAPGLGAVPARFPAGAVRWLRADTGGYRPFRGDGDPEGGAGVGQSLGGRPGSGGEFHSGLGCVLGDWVGHKHHGRHAL